MTEIKKITDFPDEYEFVKCKLCDYKAHNLEIHIRKYHNLKTKEYKDLFRCDYITSEYIRDIYKKNYKENIKCCYVNSKNYSGFSKNSVYYTEEKYKKTIEKMKKSTVNSNRTNRKLDYWLKQTNGNIDEAEKLLKKRFSTFSLKKCIKLYGENEGHKIWEQRQLTWKNSLQKKITENNYLNLVKFVSAEENDLFKELSNNLNIKLEQQFTFKNKVLEYKNLPHVYFFDIGYEEGKKIIEFNGDYWHCNPNKYKSDSYVNFPQGTMQAKDVWEKDKEKIKFATKNGYNVKIIWENDWINDREKVLNECIEFLKN